MTVLTTPPPLVTGPTRVIRPDEPVTHNFQRSTVGLDSALIFDTYNIRAEEIAAVLRFCGIPTVEIRTWENVETERQATRAELEYRLARGERLLVAANYHAIGSLKDVEQAINAAGEGTRTWIVTCESVRRVQRKKTSMGISLPSIHIPWSSDADPRLFQDRVQQFLSNVRSSPHEQLPRKPR